MSGSEQILRVGGLRVPLPDAGDAVTDYLSPTSGRVWGYPHYDLYDTGGHPDRLSDGDLLAPNLLNARVLLAGYAALQKRRAVIEEALAYVPRHVDLVDATEAQIKTLGPLFNCIQRQHGKGGIAHVRATTFSKIVHRKRPRLVPLWDSHVKAAYQEHEDSPLDDSLWEELPWRDYIVEVAKAMQADLVDGREEWRRLSEGKVTMLRTLDIVAWSAPHHRSEVPERSEDLDAAD